MLTLRNAKAKFKEFNAKYFNNTLPYITIKCPNRQTKRTGGVFRTKIKAFSNTPIFSITIYDLMESWENTLLHEMVHYYLHMKYVRKATLEYAKDKTPANRRVWRKLGRLDGHTPEFHALLMTYWNMEQGRKQSISPIPVSTPVRETVQEVVIGSMVKTSYGIGKVVRKLLDNGRVLV